MEFLVLVIYGLAVAQALFVGWISIGFLRLGRRWYQYGVGIVGLLMSVLSLPVDMGMYFFELVDMSKREAYLTLTGIGIFVLGLFVMWVQLLIWAASYSRLVKSHIGRSAGG